MIIVNEFRYLANKDKQQYKFNFCECCRFYECELVAEYTLFAKNNPGIKLPSYDPSDLADGCSMKKFDQIECGRKRVADGIGDAFKINTDCNFDIEINTDKWEPIQPVFISAQTGQGKNYFVEKTLLPYVRELNHKKCTGQKVLIISNRIALRLQIENRIKNNNQDVEEDAIYSYDDFADVISYQSILNRVNDLMKKQEIKNSKYIFVICDEAHFFTSDAIFNPYTDRILEKIVSIFKDAIRIYMSATPYECIDYISEMEYGKVGKYRRGVFYHFKRDYSYLDVRYYSSHQELTDIIVNSGDERWLVFIDNTNKCERLKKILETAGEKNSEKTQEDVPSLKGQVFTVSAKSKYNPKFQKMILNESFDKATKVLIATSVIDNGVSFRGINNIIVSDISKVKCLQMVGRARVDDCDDKITLYIKRFNEKEMENMIVDLMDKQDAYYRHDRAYGKENEDCKHYHEIGFLNKYYNNKEADWKTAKHLFARNEDDPKLVEPNTIARSLIKEKFDFKYKAILEEMKRTDEEMKVSGQKYLEYQLAWFGKKYDEENDVTLMGIGNAGEDFMNFIESYAQEKRHINKGEKESFKIEFTRLYNLTFCHKDPNNRIYDKDKINKLLKKQDINYKVVAERYKGPLRETYWVLVNFDWSSDKSKGK